MNSKLRLYSLTIWLGFLISARAYDESVFTTNTLFIEAEDADFNHGQFVTGQKIGMDGPYPGGAYKALGTATDLGFDWHAEGPNGQAYRPATGISGGKENGSAGNNRGTFTVTDWWTVGWNNGGDWYNYTRVFPSTPRDYFVYGHLASGGSPINIQVDQITSGFGLADSQQVKKLLGYFAPGRATAGWDSLELFPLTDASGNVTTVRLSGQTTLRTTVLPNSNSDQDYYAFVPVLPPQIAQEPTNITVIEGDSASFTVQLVQPLAVSFQWLRNGASIPGATNSSYTIAPTSLSDSNSQFACFVSNSAGSTNSASATLTVLPDTTPPTLVRAFNIGTTTVSVTFSEPMEPASATNPLNYSLSGGISISSAVFGSDTDTILLTTTPVTYGLVYTLTVNNVRDRAASPNTIAPGSQLTFTGSAYAPQSIGNPALGGSVTPVVNGYDVGGLGSDIGGASDQFELAYQVLAGDFDIKVRVPALSQTDPYAKAGLMARGDLTASSAFAAVLSTPSISGSFFESRLAPGAVASSSGELPVNFPENWLRLRRSANQFSGYAGYDGVTWQQLGTASIVFTNPIFVGLAVCSHDLNQGAVGQFRDISPATNAVVVASVTLPHEPVGPCSRLTPIGLSEIMYRPAARSDGLNLAFVELYNSNPYYEDISGFQLAGAINYTFPAGTILAGGAFAVVAASPAAITSVYGITNVFGPYTGALPTSGTLQLLDVQGAILLSVPYSNRYPWPVAANGTGHSIILANATFGEGNPEAWSISDSVGGSPGTPDPFRPSPLRAVLINELLTHSENPAVLDFIELYNHSAQAVDLSGCILTDDPATNKFMIPAGTLIPALGFLSFDQSQLGFAFNSAGGTVFFIKPDGTRVLDAVEYAPEPEGVSIGRFPDGAKDFYPLASRTPGSRNSQIWLGPIVINELMYDPITGNDDDQYIELYNNSAAAVSLDRWQFVSGVSFTFPPNTSLAPDSYLVIGRNVTNLLAKYSNLTTANTLGNYGGKLSHKGERVALAMPQLFTSTNAQGGWVTNSLLVVEDEVTYSAGGRWGQWAHGGGSSLELINPNSNHRLAYNWADSDETAKSVWTNLEFTGVLDNGASYNSAPIDHLQLGLLDVGECLVDNIEVRPGGPGGANIVADGGFESGLSPWTLQGDHIRSGLETALGGYQSANSLHLRSSDGIWTLGDYAQGSLTQTTLAAGQTATLRLKARWLHGWPELLMRLRGNWLEVTGAAPVPPNLGTPGARNSRYLNNAGPAIYEVKHSPPIPAAGQPVVVTARFHDFHGFQPTLLYRVDAGYNPNPSYSSVPMVDDGTRGDAAAGDGVYSATIPAQAAQAVVAFVVQARNGIGGTNLFPADLKNNAGIPRECVVAFGDPIPTGNFGHHHIFITQNWAQRWSQGGGVSHEYYDGTWVDGGGRIVYDWLGRNAGSPYHQYLGSPVDTVGGMHWLMPDDDQVYGTTSFNKQHVPGNSALDDDTLQREQTSYWMAHQIGLFRQNRRYYILFVNGTRHGPLMEDAQVPGAEMLKEYFPNDNNGWLYKNHCWFEGDVLAQTNAYMNFLNVSGCTLDKYLTTVSGQTKYKLARYRWTWWIRQWPDSANAMADVYALIDAANTSTSDPAYYTRMEAQADTEEWMRLSAMEHATGDWDSLFTSDGWNMYYYKPTMGKWTALKWDWNITLGSGTTTWPPDGSQLFTFNPSDPVFAAFQQYPAYLRAYYRALQDIANVAMNNAVVDPVLDAKYAAFVANGLTGTSFNGLTVRDPGISGGLKSWIGQMHNSILTALTNHAVANIPFAINSTIVSGDTAIITGTAPLAVKTLWFNGVNWPLTWSSVTTWRVVVPLRPGANSFSVVGVDLHNQPVSGATNNVAVTYSGIVPSPVGSVVINEIMYNPNVPEAGYVELYNNSPSYSFDVSGWQLQGLGYTFPAGSLLAPNSFLVLAANRSAFSAAYGGTVPLFDTFPGILTGQSQILALIQPGSGGTSNTVVAELLYDSAPPWPGAPNVAGTALQLIDPHQDNWRVGNWSGVALSPGRMNTVYTSLPAFPPLWLNELQADNLTGITNSAGQHAPWIEIYNPTTNTVSLNGLYLANNYTNLLQWAFPSNAVVNPGQFEVIFADGQTALSTLTELHTSFNLSPGSGSLALARLYNGQAQVLDYINYTNVQPDFSYGSFPDGQSFYRQEFFYATPGGTNNTTIPPSFVGYAVPGSLYSQDFDSLPNPGATSVNAANPVTIDGVTYSLANPYDFARPASSSGNSGGLGLPALAGWYGLSVLTPKFGATDGDQTTGGQISFGLPADPNRALGLLATSSTGADAFGVKVINQTTGNLNYINVELTGEVWRQSNIPKTLQCFYYIDPTAAAPFSLNVTAFLPGLNVAIPAVAADVGGVPVDATASINQTNLTLLNQPLTNWTPGAALWLVWEMSDPTGRGQGLAIDNFAFSASAQPLLTQVPLTIDTSSITNLVISWPAPAGQSYQLEYKDDLTVSGWTALGPILTGNGSPIVITNNTTSSAQRFYHLRIVP